MLEAKTIEIDTILPVCVKFCASHNSKVKRSACEALICCSEKYSRPDVGILAVNILMKDLWNLYKISMKSTWNFNEILWNPYEIPNEISDKILKEILIAFPMEI